MNVHKNFRLFASTDICKQLIEYLSSWNFGTEIYCIKVSLVKPTVKSGSRGFIQIFFCKFWTFLQVSTNFGILKQFWNLKQLEK
jgi:hypothetical protein